MHPLEKTIRDAEGLVLIGDSSEDRFPGYSYNAYTQIGKRFYCLDLGGLTESRGPTTGGKGLHLGRRAARGPRRSRDHLGQTEIGGPGGRGRPLRRL